MKRMPNEKPPNGTEGLALYIAYQAIKDWRDLMAGKKCFNGITVNYTEIRAFLNSEWAEFLLSALSIEPIEIINQLEAELKRQGGEKAVIEKNRRFRTGN